MATITLATVGTTFYTVQNSVFLISDARATRTVSGFGSLTVTLSVVEDGLAVSEKVFRSANKKVFETAVTTEKVAKSHIKKAVEVIGLKDKHIISSSKNIIESTTIIDKVIQGFSAKFLEGLAVSENTSKFLSINKTETLDFIDVFDRNGQFSLLLAENALKVSDKEIKSANIKFFEIAKTIEKSIKSSAKKAFEVIEADDKYIISNFKNIMESVTIFDDNHVKELSKPIKEYFGLSSSSFKKIDIKKIENLSTVDVFMRIAFFDVRLRENITVVPQISKNATINRSELLAISSKLTKSFNALKKENTNIGDKFSSKSDFKRTFAETIRNTSKIFKTFNLSRKEFIEAVETYIRHANAVISDISLGAGELTLQEFLDKTSSPPGYDKFIEFVVGEYKYQNALVRMVIDAGAAKSEPLIYDMAINVDIDDTVDRGTSQITDTTKPTKIKFNKHYYHSPEVGVAVKGGTGTDVITAEIVEIREDGFDVSLYNSSRARVIGAITWTAVGY